MEFGPFYDELQVPWDISGPLLEKVGADIRAARGLALDAPLQSLPSKGRPANILMNEMRELKTLDPDSVGGRLTIYSLQGDDDVQKICRDAYNEFFKFNALFGPNFKSVSRMEQEVQEMALSLLGGTTASAANLTSGGSESIFCGLHAARNWARAFKPQITAPEFIVPWSIHAAFSKGADIMGIQLVRVKLGSDHTADLAAMEAAITPNTIGIAGSAPCWPYGLYDDIETMAALALRYDLWMHVDACIGGFMTPFIAKTGRPVPKFDLSINGVRSISADLHKYGYAAKPCSIILWADKTDQQYHYQIIVSWPSAPYVSQSFVGSRPAGAVASAWAVMHFLGEAGYIDLANKTMTAKEHIESRMRNLGYDVWDTQAFILVAGHIEIDIKKVVAGMTEKGWHMMGTPFPPLLHFTMDAVDVDFCNRLCADLESVTEAVTKGLITDSGSLSYV